MVALLGGRSEQRSAMRRAGELGKRVEYLAFSLAGETYAVQISYINEILKLPPITDIPRAPFNVIGIISVRGKLITVIDLRRRFRLPESPFDGKTRVLLASVSVEEPVGLLVDEVLQVYRLTDAEIEPASALGGDQPAHIAGIGRPAGALLVLLELKSLLET